MVCAVPLVYLKWRLGEIWPQKWFLRRRHGRRDIATVSRDRDSLSRFRVLCTSFLRFPRFPELVGSPKLRASVVYHHEAEKSAVECVLASTGNRRWTNQNFRKRHVSGSANQLIEFCVEFSSKLNSRSLLSDESAFASRSGKSLFLAVQNEWRFVGFRSGKMFVAKARS